MTANDSVECWCRPGKLGAAAAGCAWPHDRTLAPAVAVRITHGVHSRGWPEFWAKFRPFNKDCRSKIWVSLHSLGGRCEFRVRARLRAAPPTAGPLSGGGAGRQAAAGGLLLHLTAHWAADGDDGVSVELQPGSHRRWAEGLAAGAGAGAPPRPSRSRDSCAPGIPRWVRRDAPESTLRRVPM